MTMRLTTILCLLWVNASMVAQVDLIFEPIDFGAQSDISIASAITQDDDGYIWIATEEGVLRYDSHSAVLYNEYDGLPASFSNKIGSVYHDNLDRIWVTADDKLGKLNRAADTFDQVTIPAAVSIIYNLLVIDNHLWLATFNGLWRVPIDDPAAATLVVKDLTVSHLYHYDENLYVGTRTGLGIYDQSGAFAMIDSSLIVTSIYRGPSGFLIGTFDGRLLSLRDDGQTQETILTLQGPVYDILYDSEEQQYFIGSDGGGLIVLDRDLTVVDTEKQDVNDGTSITSNGIYDLHADDNGQIWIATYGGGILKFRKRGNPFKEITHRSNDDQSIASSFTRAILETREGEIWYGTKEGLSIYDPVTERWRHKPSFSRRSKADIIMALEEDGDDVWLGTYGAGAFKVDKVTLAYQWYSSDPRATVSTTLDRVYAICKSKDGSIYLGGIGGPVQVIRDKQLEVLDISQVRDITQGPRGELVLVGRSGVHLLRNGQLENVAVLDHNQSDLDYSTINCATFQDTDHLWIGTNGDGLINYDLATNTYQVLNMSGGLPSDIIQGIVYQEGFIWASTSKGLVRFRTGEETSTLEVFDAGDGLPHFSFNYGSYEALSDGRLAFGATGGVIMLNTAKLVETSRQPSLMLQSLSILSTEEDGEIVKRSLTKEIERIDLNYKQNAFKVDFTGIDHLYPDKVRYAWRMDGVNKQWSIPTRENSVTFAGINPGSYTLQVKALDRTGASSNVEKVTIKITPPWWHSRTAYVIYLLLALCAVWVAVRIARALLARKTADEQIQFYNNITHELKTPLSILLTKLENASKTSSNIGEIKTTVHRMNSLFDQLLNFNKVSSDHYHNQKVSKISFAKHVDLIAETFKQELASKDLTFTFNNEWPSEHFYYKRDLLDKITYNLLSNAIKYSEQGGAIILTAVDDNGRIRMTVKDNGIGIPKDQQADILKRYYRARNAVNSQTPGTGLGLMIVKSLVEYDGGSISFTSEEGLGSAFTVILPSLQDKYVAIDSASAAAPSALPTDSSAASQHKARVLVVEDNDELRIDLAEKLSEHYSIVAARTGKEGLQKAKQKLPDLIITDLIMPEMDGNQLCQALQADPDTNHIPVFMMTVLNSATQKVESIKTGVTSYMTKPIDFPFLIAKIDSVLHYKQTLREKYLLETESEQAHQFEDERKAAFIKKMEDFILEKVKEENISVQDLCKHMGMSRTALYTKLKDMIDMSLQNFIITTRMNYSKKLLLRGGVTIKEVAYEVGFNNPKYFSTSFKKQFGQSPSGFLKSLNPTV